MPNVKFDNGASGYFQILLQQIVYFIKTVQVTMKTQKNTYDCILFS